MDVDLSGMMWRMASVPPHHDHVDPRVRGNSFWHVTSNPQWAYDRTVQSVDAVRGENRAPGHLHVTSGSTLRYWLPWLPEGQLHAAEIDMTGLRPKDPSHDVWDESGDYHDPTKRGFVGHPELVITNPDAVRVKQVVPFEQALAQADEEWR